MYLFKHNVEKNEEPNLTMKTKIISFLSRMLEIVPRIVLLALFAIALDLYVFYFILYRFVICVIIALVAYARNPTKKSCENRWMLTLGSIANVFFFCKYRYFGSHLPNDKKMKMTCVYYILFYLENIGLFIGWIMYTDRHFEWYFIGSIVLFVVGLITHPISLVIYSRFVKTERQHDLETQSKA